jgi:hypothetical protein
MGLLSGQHWSWGHLAGAVDATLLPYETKNKFTGSSPHIHPHLFPSTRTETDFKTDVRLRPLSYVSLRPLLDSCHGSDILDLSSVYVDSRTRDLDVG